MTGITVSFWNTLTYTSKVRMKHKVFVPLMTVQAQLQYFEYYSVAENIQTSAHCLSATSHTHLQNLVATIRVWF